MVNLALGVWWLLLGSSSSAVSPFSWSVEQSVTKSESPALNESILGVSREPSSVSLVAFHDERSYGDVADQSAWLVRYDHVLVPAPDGRAPDAPDGTDTVTVSLVFSAATKQLVAAFTNPAPVWPKSGWTSADITERVARFVELLPLGAATLRSSVIDVLSCAWRTAGCNPTAAGQITLRPRQFLRKGTIVDANGNPQPQSRAPGWVVEILGKHGGWSGFGTPLYTRVYIYRDGDLEFSGGLKL